MPAPALLQVVGGPPGLRLGLLQPGAGAIRPDPTVRARLFTAPSRDASAASSSLTDARKSAAMLSCAVCASFGFTGC